MLGQPPGFLCQYVTVPSGCAIHLPDAITWDEAACIQPLAIAVHVRRSGKLIPTFQLTSLFSVLVERRFGRIKLWP